jgi:AhpC/TSA family protein
MLIRGCICALAFLILESATSAEESWLLRGRVVDSRNQPVANVQISANWNANGLTAAKLEKVSKNNEGKTPEFCGSEGQMEPKPTWVKTDRNGDFSMAIEWRELFFSSVEHRSRLYDFHFLLAIDEERKRGALIPVDPRRASSRVEVKLQPLVRVVGRVRIAGTGSAAKWSSVGVRVPEDPRFAYGEFELARCSSVKSRFELLLPPGDYLLDGSAELPQHGYGLIPFHAVKLSPGQREVDVGTLEMKPLRIDPVELAYVNGTWRGADIGKLYGQLAPNWHAVDTRGIQKDAQPSKLKGKWILLCIWDTHCAACIGRDLPMLAEFYGSHRARRDQFEIVSVCYAGPEVKTMAALDRELKPIVAGVWHGKTLPFPIVLDNTLTTAENFGVERMRCTLLIDPQGRLIPGDETTLAGKLTEPKRIRGKP